MAILTFTSNYSKMEASNDLITFNVGGRIFTTTQTTLDLHNDCMLTTMLRFYQQNNRTESSKSTAGEGGGPWRTFFVDRDPDIFSSILHYMRTDNVLIPAGYHQNLGALQAEATYFNLPGLVNKISNLRKPSCELYICSRDKTISRTWTRSQVQIARFQMTDEHASIEGFIEDNNDMIQLLGKMCREALGIIEETIAEKNAEETALQSGCLWTLVNVVLGDNPYERFLFAIHRA